MKKYKKRDEQRLKEKNHDTNRDDKSIKPSREIILLQIINGSSLKTMMK